MRLFITAFLLSCSVQVELTRAFLAGPSFVGSKSRFVLTPTTSCLKSSSSGGNDAEDDSLSEADRLKQKAEELRQQIRDMEAQLGDERQRNYEVPPPKEPAVATETVPPTGPTLDNKTVLVVGANGRLGSMVCRYLLRNYPKTQVVAMVHYVGENSPTARGYARLSYEVGAEDGRGRIGSAWSSEDRTATFEFDEETMSGYNLQNLRIVECELLDPVQCETIVNDCNCDTVLWCATDFNGNQPRSVSSLDFALLFRAVANPTKGRVEVEGVQNLLGALKMAKQDAKWKSSRQEGGLPGLDAEDNNAVAAAAAATENDPTNVVFVSMQPDAYLDFETPFGSLRGIKKRGEEIVTNDFPSLSHTVLQLCRFDDIFVPEGLELLYEDVNAESSQNVTVEVRERRQINRRDAARCVVEAAVDKDLVGRTASVWTDPSPTGPRQEADT